MTGLALSIRPDLLTIYQYHQDGSEKTFTYMTRDLIGRVETETTVI